MLHPHRLDWIPLDHAATHPVEVGDMISADAGGAPIYRVLAFDQGRAWVAACAGAPARALPLDGFCWKGREP